MISNVNLNQVPNLRNFHMHTCVKLSTWSQCCSF